MPASRVLTMTPAEINMEFNAIKFRNYSLTEERLAENDQISAAWDELSYRMWLSSSPDQDG